VVRRACFSFPQSHHLTVSTHHYNSAHPRSPYTGKLWQEGKQPVQYMYMYMCMHMYM